MNPAPLGSGLWLLADSKQWVLAKRAPRKDRTKEYVHVGYFCELRNALRQALETKLREADAESIAELKKVVETAQAELVHAVKSSGVSDSE